MAKGESDRTRWQKVADSHSAFGKDHPEWMGQAIEALKPWGEQTMTLQHAFAVALQAAYERGQRGDYPQPIDYFDRYKEPDDVVEADSNGSSRRMRRSRHPGADVAMVDADDSVGETDSSRPQRMSRTPRSGNLPNRVHLSTRRTAVESTSRSGATPTVQRRSRS